MKKKLLLPATCLLAIAAVLGYQNWAPQKIQMPRLKLDKTVHPRPIAEYEPMFGIAISEQILFRESGLDLVREILRADARVYIFMTAAFKDQVEELFKKKKPFKADEMKLITRVQLEHESPWLRDYFPIPVLRTYPFLPPTPSFVDFVYRDGNSYDDAAIHQFALAINSSVEHLPIVMDGGNFMTNGEICIVSEEMWDDPESNRNKDPAFSLGDHVDDIFELALGCRRTKIVSQIPHPHVDMFLKFVNRDTILINDIDNRAMALLNEVDADAKVKIPKIKTELDRLAKDLSKNFRVIRVPMPLPVHDIFFTYVNSVIVNDTVIIPSYKNPDPSRGTYPDQRFYADYEEEVKKAYQKVGLKPVFLRADDLIKDGGAFHCITFHLPDLEAIVPDTSHLAAKPKP